MKQLFSFGWMDLWAMKPMNNDVYVFMENNKLIKEKQKMIVKMIAMERKPR